MKLPIAYKEDRFFLNKSFLFPFRNQGFSLIEVIITLAIISFIFAGGVFISIDSLRSYNFFSEEKTLVSLLRTARSRAMNNIGAVPHGVFISESEFILFQGFDFDENSQENEAFKRNRSILIEHDLKNNPIIIFKNLTGKLDSPIQLKIFDGLRESLIKVESEGRIES